MASKSPVSAASQRKVSSTPDAVPTADPTSPQAATRAFPPPQTFDFLPPLHALLSRLLASSSNNQAASSAGAGAGAAGEQQQNPQQQQQQPKASQQSDTSTSIAPSIQQNLQHQPGDTSASLVGNSATGTPTTGGVPPPLEAKNLPTAASAIKIRIQKARAVVEKMPDVDRSVPEQQEEIEELEDRIARLKSVIAEFGRRAAMPTTNTIDEKRPM